MLNLLLSYLRSKLKKKEFVDYYYDYNKKRRIYPREAIYSLFVLALNGKPDISAMNFYKSDIENLSLDSKYLLSAAYALRKKKKKYREILPASFKSEKSVTETGGSFSSPIRDEALALYLLLEVDPDNEQIGIMAKHVSEALLKNDYLNTQENCFGFLSIGKLAQKISSTDVRGKILINKKLIKNVYNNTVTLYTNQLKEDKIEIKSTGNGKLYYFYSMEGIPFENWFVEKDNYLKVRKRIYDRNSNIANLNNIKQSELLLIELSLQSLNNQNIEKMNLKEYIFMVNSPFASALHMFLHFVVGVSIRQVLK